MRIFVAGATGVLGNRTVLRLLAAGHDVTGVARSEAKAAALIAVGARPARVDLFDAAGLVNGVAAHEVVMNLATHIPPLSKASRPGAWAENDRIRTEGSRNLVDAAIKAGARRYVQESIALFYADHGDVLVDEDSAVEPPPASAAFLDAEAQAQRFTDAGGIGVALRFGNFYASDSHHTEGMLKLARMGVSPFPGSRDEYFPVIHADDAADAVLAAVEAPAGLYNVAAPAETKGEAADALARLLGRKKLRFAPRAVQAAGGAGARALMRSVRVSSERFRQATGWEPTYPTAEAGYAEVLRTSRP
ncbi:MAG TPA: NAD(P)-dependent oxidoreductase [Nocardioidaceae bacterium]|nr:NAD(P)-dependent oxidoreductase [Nocardioidaceae bacterium]